MNVANSRMLRRRYEICSLHLNKFYPLLPQISVFWKLMHSIACFIQITAKVNYTAFYHYEDVALFQKKPCKHELISRVQERHLASGNQRSICDIICKIAQFKMADVKNFEAIFQCKKLAKLNKRSTDLAHVMHVLNDYEVPKIAFFWVYMPFTAIDLYHTAAIWIPMRTKSFVFACPASHWMRGGTAKSFVSALQDKVLLCDELPIVFVH